MTEVPIPYRPRLGGESKVSGTVRGSVGAAWKLCSCAGALRALVTAHEFTCGRTLAVTAGVASNRMLGGRDAMVSTQATSLQATLTHHWAILALTFSLAAWLAIFSHLVLTRHWALGTHAEDLGFTDQVIWNTLHGRPFHMTVYTGGTWNTEIDIASIPKPNSLLAFHVGPMLLAFGAGVCTGCRAGLSAGGADARVWIGRAASVPSDSEVDR